MKRKERRKLDVSQSEQREVEDELVKGVSENSYKAFKEMKRFYLNVIWVFNLSSTTDSHVRTYNTYDPGQHLLTVDLHPPHFRQILSLFWHLANRNNSR